MKLEQDMIAPSAFRNAGENASEPQGPAPLAQDPAVSLTGSAERSLPRCQWTGPVEQSPRRSARASPLLIPLVVVLAFAVLFVGWEEIEQLLFPALSTGFKHALLTVRAAAATALGSTFVYLMMRRQQQRLSATAEQLSRLLASYRANPSGVQRFENPHLVHCRETLGCQRKDCPMYNAPGERCWQLMALQADTPESQEQSVTLERCQQCIVYRTSCPDKLTELGESFNNLMFLLEAEAGRVGQMRAQMVEKQKMVAIGQIAAGIAHEVCNPLSSISSIAQMLKRRGADPAAIEQLALIETHIQRISATVRQLVSLARPGTEHWERVNLANTLNEAVHLVSFDRRARGVDIRYEPPRSLPPTYALPGQLQQVFLNLFLNALDAMPQGGTLRIRAAKQSRKIVLVVEDTGCGIPPEVGRRVFEPFFTTKEPGRGSGLGLAVSYGIIQKHGGSIDFSSIVGTGTIFTVQLPILDEAPKETWNGSSHGTTGR